MRPRVLAIILAGGKGERLYPLTRERGKPAVPFGGKYRIIDFVISNFVNSGIYALYVLVQYKAQSLIEHLRNAWRLGGLPDHFIIMVPPQMRWGESWYQGTADAVYQNLNLIRDFHPDLVVIFGADHVYRMDISQMTALHLERGADITVAALPVPIDQGSTFGILEADEAGRITRFEEKPKRPAAMPGDPTRAFASMGNYVFSRDVLVEALVEDARRSTDHDFGRTIIPEHVAHLNVCAYNFLDNAVPGIQPYEERGYWRDVGTITAYWQAHMDLLGRQPLLNLDNERWPIVAASYQGPSARIIEGEVQDSLIGEGSVIDGAVIRRSILGRSVRVERGAVVEESVVMDHTVVGPGARLRRVIADRYNLVPAGARIGGNTDADRLRYHLDPSGLVVLPRGQTR
ncbi:MAG TPA: glucose-1-phosphate adenylyltransferase [bacterium]|nr:glucose-1-phosphate adenylyltransferase [bacterium]